MWIDAEPGEWLMMRYMLCFEPGDPNPEDRRVRAYLRERGLQPKRTWTGERGGIACEVLQYGQCYLGGHLRAVYLLRRQGVVSEAVGACLAQNPDLNVLVSGMTPEETRDAAWTLAGRLLDHEAARPAQDDPSQVLLDVDFLREELTKLRGQTYPPDHLL